VSRPEPEFESETESAPEDRSATGAENRATAATHRRAEILLLLAGFGGRRPEQVPEALDSMELAWLIHQIEQRHNTRMDLDDAVLARMTTVSGVATVLNELEFG
jgi:hypothetical protein